MRVTIGHSSFAILFDVEKITELETLRHEHLPTSRVVIFIVMTLKPSLRSIKHHVKCVMLYCDRPLFRLAKISMRLLFLDSICAKEFYEFIQDYLSRIFVIIHCRNFSQRISRSVKRK